MLGKIIGSANDREIKTYSKTVSLINDLEPKYHAMQDDELRHQTEIFRERLKNGETEMDILPDAFAAVREASIRSLGMRHFDVQLIGGMVLVDGKIAEMKTGEGKTLVATLAMYLKALSGQGTHLVTVNDYLAARDAEWMGKLYKFMGLSVGIIQHDMNDDERRNAYACDITYVTNSELGFDYLRDNMKFSVEQQVLRPMHFAIVDEVDSILIDEARTPLIISGPAEDSSGLYMSIDNVVKQLKPEHYKKDEKDRHVTLTEEGVDFIQQILINEKLIEGNNLYDSINSSVVNHIQQSLLAHLMYQKDVNYVVRSGQVMIVDEFTGRVLEGRRFSRGLHQALEAKEHVEIQPENQTMSSISYQNLFRIYPKLSGMTGTAMTEATEFEEIYKLQTVSIPTNRPVSRIDHHDEIYRTRDEKYDAILNVISDCQKRGQPVLVGTITIEKSEELAQLIEKKLKLKPAVLNAKQHEREGRIIAQAGQPGALTIATNMAGRGTDIKLGGSAEDLIADLDASDKDFEKKKAAIYDRVEADKIRVLDAGGLYVIGTERHESRRIDNQLRGRSGRQGDPGNSKFFLSLQDDLMRIFGASRLDSMLVTLGLKPGEAIIHPWISKALAKAQKRVEERHFEARKELLKYDNVMNEQRLVVYKQRHELMTNTDLHDFIIDITTDVVEQIAETNIPEKSTTEDWNIDRMREQMLMTFGLNITDMDKWRNDPEITDVKAFQALHGLARDRYDAQRKRYGNELMHQAERQVTLHALDTCWKKHLQNMDHLQAGIGLRGYGQKNPLNEYKKEAFELFAEMMYHFKVMALTYICRLELSRDDLDAMKRDQEQHDENLNEADVAENQGTKVSRNDQCPCGSGKKYKHCCGKLV